MFKNICNTEENYFGKSSRKTNNNKEKPKNKNNKNVWLEYNKKKQLFKNNRIAFKDFNNKFNYIEEEYEEYESICSKSGCLYKNEY